MISYLNLTNSHLKIKKKDIYDFAPKIWYYIPFILDVEIHTRCPKKKVLITATITSSNSHFFGDTL